MTVRVKSCGLNDPAGFAAAVDAGADWVGFVFFPPSPRAVTPAQAAALSATRPGGPDRAGPGRVGLFGEPADSDSAAVLDAVNLDALQLYTDAARAAAIGARFGRPVWRAIGVATPADLPAEADATARFVIEAKPPRGATRPGGNAVAFDWPILRGWMPPAPWILAGGLTPETVAGAIAASGAEAVDVSSGVETTPGVKDPARIRAFIAAARG